MKKPNFGVIIGVALLVFGGLSLLVDSNSKLGSLYVLFLNNVNIPVLILAALILIANIYNRSKIEMTIMTFLVSIIPFLVKADVQQTIGSNRDVHAIGGSYLIWIGSIIIMTSTLLSKSESKTAE